MKKVKILAIKTIATDSPDHIEPCGTANDNTTSEAFVGEMIARFGPDMAYLDIGCAGGGFVKQFIDQNILAVGLEGSDYSLTRNRAEWATIPDYLFTADVTKEYDILDETGMPIYFDVISAWDVMEHFHKDDIPFVITKIHSLLKDNGIFVASIHNLPHHTYHQTCESREWWVKTFADYGLVETESVKTYGRNSVFDITFKKA